MKKLNIVVWICIIGSLIILNLANSPFLKADIAGDQDKRMVVGYCTCHNGSQGEGWN